MKKLIRMLIISMPSEYQLVVIEEEKIPLVESFTKDYEKWLMIIGGLIVFFLILAVFLFYATTCEWRRKRIKELEGKYGEAEYMGWNLIRLEREIDRLEMEAIENEKKFKKCEPNLIE